jgi:hypothetical protein
MSEADPMSEPGTLGHRLDGLGRRLAARHDVDFPWSAPLGVLLDQLTGLPSPADPRFARREATRQRLVAPGVPKGRALAADVTARLRPLVGDGVEAVRVHDNDAADARARAHRADAVSVGADVHFRAGQLRPREPRGFALLAHEATHVVERLRPGASWRRSTAGGVDDEERLALTREAYALAPPAGVPGSPSGITATGAPMTSGQMPGGPPGPAPMSLATPAPAAMPAPAPAPASTSEASSGSPPASLQGRPMTAASDRVVGLPAAAGIDVEALKAGLLRDLIGQLRDEFERGG